MFRIKIKMPGGRFGQRPSEMWFSGMDGYPELFRTRDQAQREIDRMMGTDAYKAIPAQFRPTYHIV